MKSTFISPVNPGDYATLFNEAYGNCQVTVGQLAVGRANIIMRSDKHRLCHRCILIIVTLSAVCASGCAAIPPAFSQASWALSGVSYVTTSKGPSDHVISYAVKKDCSLFRLIKLQVICKPVTDNSNQSLLSLIINKFDKPTEDNSLSFSPQVVSTIVPQESPPIFGVPVSNPISIYITH